VAANGQNYPDAWADSRSTGIFAATVGSDGPVKSRLIQALFDDLIRCHTVSRFRVFGTFFDGPSTGLHRRFEKKDAA
jgi:hypothetical protein